MRGDLNLLMKRILTHVLLLMMSPGLVYALGLGNIDLNSTLNEPFDARIELLSSTAEELESLKVGLGDSESFRRAGIDRLFILGQLKFAVRETEDGPDYIRVYSTDPIREPFLNFLLEASWSKGRLFREYTVLLDPPLYDPSRGMKVTDVSREMEELTTPDISTSEDATGGHVVVYGEEFSRHITRPSISYSGDDYGPTKSLDTLWSIASAMRPDASISVNQMMLALLRTNPEAFINNNINELKRGQILRMPDASEINALTFNEALAEVKSQYAMWDEIRGTVSAAVSERPAVSVPAEPMPSEIAPTEEAGVMQEEIKSEAELRLVTPTGEGEGSDQVASDEMGADTGATVAAEKLVLAKESIEALTQENLEFKDRLQESEVLIDDLKRLIALKDDELVALQKQFAQAQVMEEEAAEKMPEAIEEVEEVMPAEEVVEAEMAEEEEATADEIEEVAAAEEVAEEEMVEEEEEPVTEEEAVVDEGIEETTGVQPSVPSGVMDIAGRYLGLVKNFVMGNQMIAMAGGGLLVVLILIAVLMKFRGRSAAPEAVSLASEFPDFSEEDIGRTEPPASQAATDIAESEAVTVIPESEVETEIADDATQIAMQPSIAEAPAEEEPEEDPMQEVNTYLAFEQFDQAEEFIRQALENEPDNPEYHVKLLEVFYTSGNKKSYEEAARVLHDKVGGEGDHWSMAVAMWQEMSPNRALFEAPVAGEEDETTEAAGGGVVDITTDEEAGDDAGLDFDLGPEDAGKSEEDVLDLTTATDATEDQDDLLDVTAAVGLLEDEVAETMEESEADQMVDIAGGTKDGEMLDITAGIEEEEVPDITAGAEEEEMLDITAGAEEEATEEPVGGEDDMLDLMAGEELDEDVLDISQDGGGEDLLDVTSSLRMQPDSDEDLLDVTAATSAGANSDELLEINAEPEVTPRPGKIRRD
jgi:pilus assembly protein FimV